MGRMKQGNRAYSFRSPRAEDFIVALRKQFGIISGLVEIKRKSTMAANIDHITHGSERHQSTVLATSQFPVQREILQPDRNTEPIAPLSMSPLSCFEYEDLSSKSSTVDFDYETESTEFNSFPESVKYDMPDDISTETSEFSSYCSDVYPFVNNSFDSKEFNYESLSESDRRCSAPVIYQDVDIAPGRKDNFVRRRSRLLSKPLKPTFISYIEGGSEALEAVYGCKTRHHSDPSQSSSDLETSGVYCKLFDPKLLKFSSEQCAKTDENDGAYDILKRDPSTKKLFIPNEFTHKTP